MVSFVHCNLKPTPIVRHMNCRHELTSKAAGSPKSTSPMYEAPTLAVTAYTSRVIYQRPKCERKYHSKH